jgi:hypothetical protein
MPDVRIAQSLDLEHPVLSAADEPLLPAVEGANARAGGLNALDWRQVVGGAVVLIGFATLAVGWWRISGTTKTYEQLNYLLGGGLIGAALVAIGGVVIMAYQHHADRLAMVELERRIAGEFDLLYDRLGLSANRSDDKIAVRVDR